MTKKRIAAIVIDSLFIIATLLFIFGNSLLDKSDSTDKSDNVTHIVEKLPPVQSALEEEKITNGDVEAAVRSLAHVAEFGLLGAEVMLLVLLVGLRPLSLSAFLPFFFCLIIGLADECLQLKTDRAAEVVDVLKDFAGSLFGGGGVLVIYGLRRFSKKT
ncbi:MAG: VanZ family protein [Clostridia bacterium]|nr:VanZ family protein [Clostridia bacterium]